MLALRLLQRLLGQNPNHSITNDLYQVTRRNGFLPRLNPLATYANSYQELNTIMPQITIHRRSTSMHQLLKQLPSYDFTDIAEAQTLNSHNLRWSLYRDYAFLASAYLLEPCYLSFIDSGKMNTVAHNILPAKIAQPLDHLAQLVGGKPFLEYTHYATHNWQSSQGYAFDDLSLIRAFEGSASESGFILVHVQIMQKTIPLIGAITDSLYAIHQNKPVQHLLSKIDQQMYEINHLLRTMWHRSRPADYNSFRVFIFGILNQSMFPQGVIYEGVDPLPRFYRGESGANDNLIPMLDSFTELNFPENDLTAALRDFRSYRPQPHQEFIYTLASLCNNLRVANYCIEHAPEEYVRILMQIACFRSMHWSLTKEYIIKRSAHPMATGGTPITQWLPNQLMAVYRRIIEVAPAITGPKGLAWRKYISIELERLQAEVTFLQCKYK